jgi:hypothetical protein
VGAALSADRTRPARVFRQATKNLWPFPSRAIDSLRPKVRFAGRRSLVLTPKGHLIVIFCAQTSQGGTPRFLNCLPVAVLEGGEGWPPRRCMALGHPLLTWTLQQVGSFLRCTGHQINVAVTAVRDPQAVTVSSQLSAGLRFN